MLPKGAVFCEMGLLAAQLAAPTVRVDTLICVFGARGSEMSFLRTDEARRKRQWVERILGLFAA